MIKKWDLSHAPNSRDSLRYKLLLSCDMKDVFFLMKKLGSSCSRPEKGEGEYNHLVYILKADKSVLEKAKQAIAEMSQSKTSEQNSVKDFAETSVSQPHTAEKSQREEINIQKHEVKQEIPVIKEEAKIEPSKEEIKAEQPPLQKKTEEIPIPEIPPAKESEAENSALPEIDLNALSETKKEAVLEETESIAPAAPKTEEIPLKEPPLPTVKSAEVSKKEEQILQEEKTKMSPPAPIHSPMPPKQPGMPSIPKNAPPSAKPSFAPPSTSMRIKKEEAEESKKEETKQAEEKKEAIVAPSVSARTKSKWPIELPLNPTLSFQTLIPGPHNRFAHAAAMAVVENPGVMYNPLLIFGPQGIGKSHFIHSIGYGLSTTLGQRNIFVTHAVKFSRGIDMAIEQNTIEALEKMISEISVLIIDDIDLFMITEKNKPYISRILNQCIDTNKQIILSSMFPPKSLAPLEENIGFQFTQGWMVDIKFPNAQTYRIILNQMLSAIDIKISEDDIKTIFVSKMLDFRSVAKVLAQAKKMEKYLLSVDASLIHKDFLSMLLGLSGDDETFPSDDEVNSAKKIEVGFSNQWFKWGIFYPKGLNPHAHYVLNNLKSFASSELKMDIQWDQIFFEEYDPDEVYGTPFKIGEFSAAREVNGVIVLGPQSTSALGSKEQEFRNITEKILESFSLKAAWIESSKLKARSSYLKALMELL